MSEILCPFNPVYEFDAGRYVFNEELGFGKFNKCYTVPVLSNHGEPFLLGTFQSDHISFIDQACLPSGVFVPNELQIRQWNQSYFSDWDGKPGEILEIYGVRLHDDVYHHGDIHNSYTSGNFACLATSSHDANGMRKFLAINNKNVRFTTYGRCQCAYVPIFFDRSFSENL